MISSIEGFSLRKIGAVDSTLREGRQRPGLHLNVEDSIKYTELAAALGVEYVEQTHPASSPQMAIIIDTTTRMGLPTKVATHIRANEKDFDAALATQAEVHHVYIPGNPNSIYDTRQSIHKAQLALERKLPVTRQRKIEVRASLEHGLSIPLDLFAGTYAMLGKMDGVDRVGLAETNGDGSLEEIAERVKTIFEVTPSGMPLELHFHQDLGLAPSKMWTALCVAAAYGRRVDFDYSMGGYGERNGILSSGDFFAMLYSIFGPEELKNKYSIGNYAKLVKFFETNSGLPIPDTDPLNYPTAFTHSSGPHVQRMVRDGHGYGIVNSEDFGFGPAVLHVGHATTGAEALQAWMNYHMGMDLPIAATSQLASLVRVRAMEIGPLNPNGQLTEFLMAELPNISL